MKMVCVQRKLNASRNCPAAKTPKAYKPQQQSYQRPKRQCGLLLWHGGRTGFAASRLFGGLTRQGNTFLQKIASEAPLTVLVEEDDSLF